MTLLKAIGIVMSAFGALGLVLLSLFLFEWVAFGFWMSLMFIFMVYGVYRELI